MHLIQDNTTQNVHTLFSPQLQNIGAACSCWMCQNSLSARAAFCHECGTIQPPRPLDHFTRLGLECRYDIDLDTLTHRYQAMQRVFTKERTHTKGPRQQQMADDQAEHIEHAYQTLRDPLSRAAYLLTLQSHQPQAFIGADTDILELREELGTAADGIAIDRLAFKARHAHEMALRDLARAFREQNFASVTILLARLPQLEDIATSARIRRGDLA